MNRKLLGTSLYQAVCFAGFIIFAHYSEKFLGEIGDGFLLYSVLIVVLPLIILISSTLVEKIRRVLPFIAGTSTIIGSYGLVLTAPNFVLPLVNMSSGMAFWYFLSLLSMLVLFVSSQDVLINSMRDIKGGISLKDAVTVGGSYTIGGVAGAISMFFGRQGWLYPVMIFTYFIPIGLLFHYFLVKFGSRPEIATKANRVLRKKRVMNKDKSHAFKMTFFSIGEFLILMLLVLASGMASFDDYLVESRWYFWLGLIIATGVSIVVLAMRVRKLQPDFEEVALGYIIPIQKHWITTIIVAWGSAAVVASLDLFVEAYRGTPVGSLIDGIVAGIGLGTYILLVFVLNPGRRKWVPTIVVFILSWMIMIGMYLAPMVDQGVLDIIADYLFVFPVIFMVFIAIQLLSLFLSLGKMQKQVMKVQPEMMKI